MTELRSGYPSHRGFKAAFHLYVTHFYLHTSQNTIFIGWSCDVVAVTHPAAASSATLNFIQKLGYLNSLGFQMAEGGVAEKFPDKWDIQFLGNVVASQLAAGTPVDFLIRRYIL